MATPPSPTGENEMSERATAQEKAAERRQAWADKLSPISPKDDAIILTCKLKSGQFESSIEVPLYATREEMNNFAMQWLALMDAGIKIGQNKHVKDKP